MHESRQDDSFQDRKSGGEVAEQFRQRNGTKKRLAKTDVRYWETKLFHDAYTRDGERVQQAMWSVRIQHAGRRETFSLDSANKTIAGAKARDIYLSLKGSGWEATLQAHKPEAAKPVISDATVGDLLREVGAIGGLKPKTFADYAKAFRKITADIQGIKSEKDKFNPHTGGRQKWLEKVEATPLAEITPERIQKWKLSFLRRAGNDPAKLRRAKISVNSLLRQAKSLFSKKVVRFLSFKLPTPRPFDGVDFEPRQTMRYHSTVDVKVLIKAAVKELAGGDGDKPEQYKVFLLSLCAGLRRNEIDKLEWAAFDFKKHLIRIQATEFFHPKTEDSSGDVEIDPEIAAVFSVLHGEATGRFVVRSDRMAIVDASYSTYRCQKVFEALLEWLRKKGVTALKPLHELRKEFGSTIANEHGIFAASRALRHADIAITTQHYADKTRRVTTGFGKLLAETHSTPIPSENCIVKHRNQ